MTNELQLKKQTSNEESGSTSSNADAESILEAAIGIVEVIAEIIS